MTEAASAIQGRFPVLNKTQFRGETSLSVPLDQIHDVCRFCRDELGFDYLLDLSAVDHLGEEPRFELVYELYHMGRAEHLRLKAWVAEDGVEPPTVCDIWPTAEWHEREVFDMMGIRFANHPDLRRILMWEGYPYFPLRKDFPLAGKPSEVPEVAFTAPAPLAGGPFVTTPTTGTTKDREPRSRDF